MRADSQDPTAAAGAADWQAEAESLRAREPRHILFLCVANSARSQMAEGLAWHMARGRTRMSSAGSEPGHLNPLAVEALAEVGIDISAQHSKGLDGIDGDSVDVVITLCAEEVCPAWLGKVARVHWGLPDPAAIEGSHEERLAAFRAVRDELKKRLQHILAD